MKYTRMHHFEKKNSKMLSLKGSRENVSPGPAVALDGPAGCPASMVNFIWFTDDKLLKFLQLLLHKNVENDDFHTLVE